MKDLLKLANELRFRAHDLLQRVEALDNDMRKFLETQPTQKTTKQNGRTVHLIR